MSRTHAGHHDPHPLFIAAWWSLFLVRRLCLVGRHCRACKYRNARRTMTEMIKIDGVTAEQMEAAGKYLARSGVEGFNGHSGSVRGECFAAEYEFDPSTGVLTVHPSELPHAFRKAPEAAVAPAFSRLV